MENRLIDLKLEQLVNEIVEEKLGVSALVFMQL